MKRDILITVVSQAISLLAGFGLMAVLASWYGEYGVGFYTIIRRVPTAYTPIVLMGASIALSRELLRARDEASERYASLVVAAWSIMAFNLALSALVIVVLQDFFYQVVVGKEAIVDMDQRSVVVLVFVWLCNSSMFTLAYAFLRGRLDFIFAAALQTTWALVPFVLLYPGRSWTIEKYVSTLGWVYLILSVLLILLILGNTLRTKSLSRSSLAQSTRYILSFGVPRLPLFFVFSWILNGGIFLLGLIGEQGDSARYSLSFSLLRYVAVGVSSVGIVVLPRMRASDARRNSETAQVLITFVLDTAMPILAVALALFPWYMLSFLHIDPGYTSSIGVKFLILLGVPGIMAYELLRNVLDAVAFRAYNTANSIASVVCAVAAFVALYWAAGASAVDAVNISTGILFLALGILTVWRSSVLLEVHLKRFVPFPLVQLLVGLGMWFLGLNYLFVLAALAITFVAGLAYLRRPWVAAVLPH